MIKSYKHSFDKSITHVSTIFKQGSYGISLDTLTEKLNFFPDYIKIDVDGNEIDVMQGATNLLKKKTKSILIEFDERIGDAEIIKKIFDANGFKNLKSTQHSTKTNVISKISNNIFVKQ